MLPLLIVPALLAAVPAGPAVAQDAPRSDSTSAVRDRTNTLPLVTSRTARFTTDEGTWMSVDVSPDGSTIAFDLLGDIYTIPIAGGKATRIIGGNSVDMHPRYSPDGKSLVFVSDRNGSDATWLADADGKRIRLLTNGGVYPVWTPDGREVVTGNRLVDARGGAGIPLQGIGAAASLTGDGRYIWFQAGTQAARYDRTNGTITSRTALPGGVLRPMVSKDGKRLAYFTRFEAKSALVVRDLATGREQWVVMGTQPEAFIPPPPFIPTGPLPAGVTPPPPPPPPGLGPLPTSAWLPDESAIVTSYGGKLWRVEVPSGKTTPIPFTADVEQSLGALVRSSHEIGDSVFAREIREPSLSPDGRRMAFTALGKVWVMALPGGTPRRLTTATNMVEMSPTWTPDGQSVTYATWVDAAGGDILQVSADGGTPRNLTRAPAMYTRLNYTPDGSRLVFARAPRQAWTLIVNEAGVQPRTAAGAGTEINFELRWMAPPGGAQHSIAMVADVGAFPLGGYPHFTSDTSRVFFHDGTALVSVAWDGSDRRVVLARAAPQTVLSPDGVHVLSRAGPRHHIYMFERPQVADSVTIDPMAPNPVVPMRRLTRAGGDFPSFSRDGSKAVWAHGTTLHVYEIAQGDKATADSLMAALSRGARAPAAADSARPAPADSARRPAGADSAGRWAPAFDATGHEIRIALAADKPSGVVVLRGARIVTMKDREIIENGDLVITGNRITAVGSRGSVTIPRGARTIDVTGKTILPGYVDVHAQMAAPSQVHRTVVPQYLANLAFGVTTTRDPESRTLDIFTYGDRVALGELAGPRVFATGPTVLDTGATLRTNTDARTFIGPYATTYRTGTIRGDLTATRADRQRFLTISKELGLTAVANGAPDFRRSLSAILDGYANHLGAYEIFPLHNDVAKLIAESGLIYTPMLLGRVGNQTGMTHILATEAPHADAKARRFSTHRDLDRLTRGRLPWLVAAEYPFDLVATGAARIVANGGKIALGSNGRVQGLALHWEMWLLSQGGLPNHDILRAATIFGAEAIGAGSQLGSIENGKLADLQVLDLNPLTNIRNTNSVRYVMKNGRLYDAMTLDQIAPVRKPMDNLWWLANGPAEEQR
jgi:imidazolonepropionase-like amidohydrolase/Tol biopolymer transport system component